MSILKAEMTLLEKICSYTYNRRVGIRARARAPPANAVS